MKLSSGSRVVPCGRTDRHDEAIGSFFVIFRTNLKIMEWARLEGTAVQREREREIILLWGLRK